MTMNAVELASRFRIAGALDFVEAGDGLVKAVMSRSGMTGELALQGAQVTAWQPTGARPVIFVSSRAVLAPDKAIRGGIPVIFPWFGPHPTDPKAPQHGFVRTAPWQLDSAAETADGVTLELSLAAEGFGLTYRAVFGDELRLHLEVRNTSPHPAMFEEALHSYFAVSDVERISVSGLENRGFIDKTDNMRRCPAAGAPLRLTKETDRVYLDVPDRLAISDPGWNRRIVIEKSGGASTIVWNPWPEKAAAMSDLGADNWRGFVCVETGNVADNRITLAAGAAHEMATRIRLDAQ
ncbi:MAG: D-hexose-6-phosphate mutarotase [Stellaceae bacterium]